MGNKYVKPVRTGRYYRIQVLLYIISRSRFTKKTIAVFDEDSLPYPKQRAQRTKALLMARSI